MGARGDGEGARRSRGELPRPAGDHPRLARRAPSDSTGPGGGADVLVTLDMAQPVRLLGLGKPGAAGAPQGDQDKGAKNQP